MCNGAGYNVLRHACPPRPQGNIIVIQLRFLLHNGFLDYVVTHVE